MVGLVQNSRVLPGRVRPVGVGRRKTLFVSGPENRFRFVLGVPQ